MGAVKRETGGVVSQDGKPPLTGVGLEGGVYHRRHKLLLVYHKSNGPRAPQHIDAYQQPLRVLVLLLLAHRQHRQGNKTKKTTNRVEKENRE